MPDMGRIMKQARKLQERMNKLQEQLASETVEASTGGGMVKVVANGKREIRSIEISPEVVDPGDDATHKDHTADACHQCCSKADPYPDRDGALTVDIDL